jgi:SsrA-binding protein
MPKAETGERVLATNRKALFQYEVLERAEAGIALVGTEVKSIRDGGLNFSDSYVDLRAGELFLVGCRVAPYSHGSYMNHVPDRDRKLLFHKREILRLGGRVAERGLTLVPLRVYLKNGRVKMEIGLARGKHVHDKREAIKKKDQEREARQALRRGGRGRGMPPR